MITTNRIVSYLEALSLRQRFLVAPLLGLILLIVLTAAFTYESQRENALLTRVAEEELAGLDRYSDVFIALSEQHMALYDLLNSAPKTDEETLYDRAKERLYAIHEAIHKLKEALPAAAGDRSADASSTALRAEVLALTEAYRRAATSAVELTTVNLELAPGQIALANDRFIAMNRAFAKLLGKQRQNLASEIAETVAIDRASTTVLASAGVFVAALLLVLSLALSRLLSRALEAQISVLAQLGDQAGAPIKVEGADEVGRISQAIAVFRHMQLELRESEARYRQLVDLSPDAIYVQSEGQVAFLNSACMKLLGATTAEELIGKPVLEFIHPDLRSAVTERIRQLSEESRLAPPLEGKLLRLDGATIDVEVMAAPFAYQGKPGAQIVMRDITQRKKTEERLIYLAQYDSLTGLPNRNLLRDRLSHAVARAKRSEKLLALMLLDLDHFKKINDTLGHTTGDEVLQAVAALLRETLREVDTIARLGGDEFTLILENITHVDQVTTIAEKIQKAFVDPIVIRGQEIFVTASIGITVYPFNVDDVDTLLQTADVAMYHAKEMGRNTYEFYAHEMNAEAGKLLEMEGLLRRALDRRELLLHYQPTVLAGSRQLVGVEALIRWNCKELGLVLPERVLPLAEETGLIVPIGEWILKTACTQNKAWQDQGFPPLFISVNLSPRQFRQKNLVEMIAGVLGETGLDARFLELEITESLIMEDVQRNIEKLKEIQRLGLSIAIDDFGTGYSSLGYLAKLPVRALKIDRSFIMAMLNNSDAMTLVSTIISLARSLGLKVVAEGVETEEQAKVLRLLRCDEMQGYLVSQPLPWEELSAFLEQTRQRGAVRS